MLTRYEASEGFLILISVRLPPVWVVLTDDVEDVSLTKGQSQFSARHVWVVGWVVGKVCLHMHLERGWRTISRQSQRNTSKKDFHSRDVLPKSVREQILCFESWGWSELWGVRACWTKERAQISVMVFYNVWTLLGCGSHQDVVDVIDALPTDRDAVDLQDFIPLTEETALLCRPTADHPTDDHTVTIVSNCHTLDAEYCMFCSL